MKRVCLCLWVVCAAAVWDAQAVTSSGLPIPRFVTLKSNEANVRSGPGTRYPIQWVYRRQGLPLEVIEEYGMWRKIRDVEGTVGWVHKMLVQGRRNVLIRGDKPQIVRIDTDPESKPILKLSPDVIARVIECEYEWCKITVSDRKGWLKKAHLWGVYENEIIE